jgi:hypothetical protein
MATRPVEAEDADILDRAQKRIVAWYAYWGNNIEYGKQEARFLYETQWSSQEIGDLKRLRKPIIQINKIAPQIEKIIGEYRESTPTAEVYPENAYVTQDELDLVGNILRTISYKSREDILIQDAFEQALVRSYSALFCFNDFEENSAFIQNIYTRGMVVPECAFFDPSATAPNKEDGEFCGYYDFVPREMFTQEYPDVEIPNSNSVPFKTAFRWLDKNGIAICYYTEKKWYDSTAYLIKSENGEEEIDEEELKNRLEENEKILQAAKQYRDAEQQLPPDLINKLMKLKPTSIEKNKKIRKYKIMMYKMIYGRILEVTEFPCQYLNGVYIDGKSYVLDGRQKTQSFFHHAKAAQRLHNTAAVEQLAGLKNCRKEQFLVNKDHVAGDQMMIDSWKNPENQQGALFYATPTNPRTPERPDRLDPIPLNPIFSEIYQQSGFDIDSNLGGTTMDARNPRGSLSKESGEAVVRRQASSNLMQHRQVDNMCRGVEQLNRIKLALMPAIYDTERLMTLHTQAGSFSVQKINEVLADDSVKNNIKSLKNKLNVRVTIGAPYQLRKEMAWNQLVSFVELFPQANNLVVDIAAKNVDIQESAELVKRTQTLLPPELQKNENGEPLPPKPPSPEQQAMALAQQIEQKKVENADKELAIQDKKIAFEEKKLEINSNIAYQKLADQAADSILKSNMNAQKTHAEITKSDNESRMHALTMLNKLMSNKHSKDT